MTVEHNVMVAALWKCGYKLLEEANPHKMQLNHGAMGVAGEAGELVDAIKKYTMYDKPLDRENVIEELGDIEFYLEALRQNLNITRDETIAANIAKLGKRYEGFKYSNEAAHARADKAE